MPALEAGLTEEISRDFIHACNTLNGAQRHLNIQDTQANRDAEVECRARIDAALDMYLELPAGRPAPCRPDQLRIAPWSSPSGPGRGRRRT